MPAQRPLVVLGPRIDAAAGGWLDESSAALKFAREHDIELVHQTERELATPDWLRSALPGATAFVFWTIGPQLTTQEVLDAGASAAREQCAVGSAIEPIALMFRRR